MALSAKSVDKPLDWYNRYARHIALAEVGEEGQLALNGATVLIVGAGGLGSPVAMYLAAAGVGAIGLADFDTVSLNNLQRQILHGTADIGRLKVASARETLDALNGEVQVTGHTEKVTPENVWELIAPYDIVVDASDNFATRFLLNDTCVQAGKPLVFGAVLMFSGQVSVFTQTQECGCYRCLYPEAPEPQYAPSCAEAGIFGAVTGIVGSLQAAETLKLILNSKGHRVGPVLENRLLVYDGHSSSFQTIILSKDASCPVCSNPNFDFRDVTYAENCAVTPPVELQPPAA